MSLKPTRLRKLYGYVVLAIIFAIVTFPMLWMFLTSFKTVDQIQTNRNPYYPKPPTIRNYVELATETDFPHWFKNSVIVTSSVVLITLIVGSMAAYSIVRINFKGKKVLAIVVLITYLVPPSLLFIPLYVMLNRYQLTNTLMSLIIVHPTFTIPFCAWFLMGFIRTIPSEIDEVALVDGANRIQIFYRITIHLILPGLVASAIFAFVLSWNNYIYALVFIRSELKLTLPVGIHQMTMFDVYPWGQLMAAAMLTSVPIVLLYAILNRYMIAGLSAGAVKG